MTAAWGSLLLAVGIAACDSPATCGEPARVVGRWAYTAMQTQPAASLTGTLTIQPGCPSFQGALAGTVDELGQMTMFDVVVVGQMVDTAAVAFSAYFGATGRQHLGIVAHDSIRGTWVEPSSLISGSFVAVKEQVP